MSQSYGSMEYRDDPSHSPNRSGRSASGKDFNTLSDEIGTNLFKINNGATSLTQGLKQLGSSKDSTHLRDQIHNTQQVTNKIVSSTSRCLHNLNDIVRKGSDKQQQLQLERLKNEFKDTVQRYNTLQKKVAETVKLSASFIPDPRRQAYGTGEEDYGEEKTSLLADESRREQLQEQQQEVEFDKELLIEREHRIRQLESDILDVNEIFKDLGAMVFEQRGIIDTIESNVEVAHNDVISGNEQLKKASQYQKSSRKKLCILVVIIVIIAAIIAIVLAVELK